MYGDRVNVPELILSGGETWRVLTDQRGSVRLVVNASTGVEVGPFFAEYVDGTRAATGSEIAEALAAADRLGVFAKPSAATSDH